MSVIARNTYGEIEVGDSIKSYVDHRNGPSRAYENGRLWSGTVRKVEHVNGRALIEVVVDGRSLCSDDLVYGFGGTPDGTGREVVYHLSHGVDEYVQRRVRDARTGRRYWSGIEAFGSAGHSIRVGEGV